MEHRPQLSDADRAAMLQKDKADGAMPKPPFEILDDGSRVAHDWLAKWQQTNTIESASNQEPEA